MSQQILFIHGGGQDGYEADKSLVASLQTNLGGRYQINSPKIHMVSSLPDFGWLKQIGEYIAKADDDLIVVGHSFGASMLLKYLSENTVQKQITGVFLIATPYWSGDEEWKQGIKLIPGFVANLPVDMVIFFYHCLDDEEVPLSHFYQYRRNLTRAHFKEMENGGHQFDNDLNVVAQDIQGLGR